MARVLVVDDTDSSRELIAKLLEIEGHTALRAHSGPEALEMVDKDAPSLILLDLMMPGMDGFAFLGHLRQRERHRALPVIIVSALADTGSLNRARALGVQSYLVKSAFSIDDLLSQVEQSLPH